MINIRVSARGGVTSAAWTQEAVDRQFQGQGRQASGQEAKGTGKQSWPDQDGLHATEVPQEVGAQTHAGDVVPTSPNYLVFMLIIYDKHNNMKMQNITIRSATVSDYESINFLYYKSYSGDYHAMPGTYKKMPATILSRGDFVNIIDDKDWDIIVAEENKIIVGMVCVSVETDIGDKFTLPYKRVSIEELYCDEKYLNQGLGDQLIKQAEKWAKKKDIKDLTAMVYSYNKSIYKLYEKNGYRSFSIRVNKSISDK